MFDADPCADQAIEHVFYRLQRRQRCHLGGLGDERPDAADVFIEAGFDVLELLRDQSRPGKCKRPEASPAAPSRAIDMLAQLKWNLRLLFDFSPWSLLERCLGRILVAPKASRCLLDASWRLGPAKAGLYRKWSSENNCYVDHASREDGTTSNLRK